MTRLRDVVMTRRPTTHTPPHRRRPETHDWARGNLRTSGTHANPESTTAGDAPRFALTFGRIPIFQPKLAVGRTDDPLEHEADAAAEAAMRVPQPPPEARVLLRRANQRCSGCGEEEKLQTKRAEGDPTGHEAPALVNDVLGSPGMPLDVAARAFFEPRYGVSFSDVRVHTDTRAALSAYSVRALGYTVGRHIVFADGQYAPATDEGRRLIAHELAHVVQQRDSSDRQLRREGDPGQMPKILPCPRQYPAHPRPVRYSSSRTSARPSHRCNKRRSRPS